jgi:hypothetical protein
LKTLSLRFALYLCVAVLMAGCSGKGRSVISVAVTGAPSTVTAGGAPVTLTAMVSNDSTNAGVTWAVTGGGTYTSTTTTLTYTPPPTVPTNATVVVTATSIADTSKSGSATFTITGATLTVTITNPITTIAPGAAAVTINATVANDGATPGVGWNLYTTGTTTNCQPACGTITNATTTSVLYTPPATVPGTPTASLVATSNSNNAVSATDSFTIQATVVTTACQAAPAPRGNETALAGVSIAFLVKGDDSSDEPIAYAGSVTFSTKGATLSAGLLDVVGFETGETGEQNVDLNTSSFSYGSDGRGCLYLGFNEDDSVTHPVGARKHYVAKGVHPGRPVKSAARSAKSSRKLAAAVADEGAVVFSFVLLNPQAGPGRIEEFDNTTGTGTVAAGQLAVQDSDAFAFNGLASTFAFGADGWANSEDGLERVAVAGQIGLNTESGQLSGVADENIGGSVNYGAGAGPGPLTGGSGTLSGTVDANTGRGTGSYSASDNEGDVTYDFAIYIIDDSDAFIISTDDPTVSGFMLSGRWLETSASSPATLSGYYLNSVNGLDCTECDTTEGNNYVSVAAFSVTGGVPAGNDYINDAGSFSNNTFNGTYAFNTTYGRVLFTDGALSDEVGYVTATASEDQIAAFTIGTDDNAGSGYIFTQSSTQPNYTNASLNGTFAFGTAEDVTGVNGSSVGIFKLGGDGNYTATIDQIFVGQAYQPDTSASGTYSVSGNGLGNFDDGDVSFVTNGTLVIAIDGGDSAQPLVYFLFEQTAAAARAMAKKSHAASQATTQVTPVATSTATSGSTGSAFARPKSN